MARIPRKAAGIGAADLPDTAAFDAYIGPAREITVDPARGLIALHDGTTAGGKRALRSGDVGSAAFQDVGFFATAAEGAKANTALQPVDLINKSIHTSLGLDFDRFADDNDIIQALLCVPNFGFDNGVVDTSIYSGARNALQGVDVLVVNGVTKVFMTQRVAGTSWTVGEQVRISVCTLLLNGSTSAIEEFTPPLNVGHGVDLSARIEGGQIYLYTSQAVTDPLLEDTNAGKGYSRIHWKGAATTQADVVGYAIWGQPGSGHPFEDFNRAAAAISSDGTRLILTAPNPYGGALRFVAEYDLVALSALGDKTTAKPLRTFYTPIVIGQSANVVQGGCVSDNGIALITSGTDPLGTRQIIEHSFDGSNKRTISFDGPAAIYGIAGILNHSTLGVPWRFEGEGVTPYGKGYIVTVAEGWISTFKVVTYLGKRYACITASDTTGVPPSNGTYWVRTTKAATDGAWSEATNYAQTLVFTNERKLIYYVGPSIGLTQEVPCSQGIADPTDPSAVPTGQGGGATSMGFQWRSVWGVRAWAERLGRYFNAIEYDGNSRLKIYDQRVGSDNDQYGSIQSNFTSTLKALISRAKGTAAADGAFSRLHAVDDPTYPHAIIEGTKADGTFSRRTDNLGTTRLISASGNMPLVLQRSDDGAILGYEKVDGTSLWTFSRSSASPEGVQTAPRGSLHARATGTGSLGLYVKDSGAGNTGWRMIGSLTGTVTYDPPSLIDGAGVTTTVTVTGAVLGMAALASFSLDIQGITITAWVSAADTVSVRLQNETGGTIDLASGTLKGFAFN